MSEPTRKFTIGVLVGIESTTSSAVAGKPDYSWVKEFNQGQSTFQILNRAVPDVIGSMVKIGRPEKPPFQRQILGPYDDTALYPGYDAGDGGSLNSSPHAQSHQYTSEATPGTDPVLVFQPALMVLKTEPTTGLSVRVNPYIYRHLGFTKEFFGIVLDLTAHVPVAGTRRVLIYIDKQTNILSVVLGLVTLSPPVPFPQIPIEGVASSYVTLTSGQTEISAVTDIVDARDFLNDGDVFVPEPMAPGHIIIADDGGNWSSAKPLIDQFGNIITDSDGTIVTG